MAKPEWGVKRLCTGCAVRFYDLTKTPAVCPSCGVEAPAEGATKAKKSRAAEPKAAEKKPLVAEPAEDAKVAVIDDGDDVEIASDVEVEVEDDDDNEAFDVLLDDEEDPAESEIGDIAPVEKDDDATT